MLGNDKKEYTFKKKEGIYISELDLRKILSQYLHSPGDQSGEVDLLDVFVNQLPTSVPPSYDSFFRRFKVDDVRNQLLKILNGA